MIRLLALLLILNLGPSLFAAGLFDFYLPWDDALASPTHLAWMNNGQAGADGFVFVDGQGHLSTAQGRIRFWGTNNCFTSNFPTHAQADGAAARMAKYGINMVRFHHMDMAAAPDGIWDSVNPDRTLSAVQLERMDYFIDALRRNLHRPEPGGVAALQL
jgi:hypothetical protein